MAILSRDEFFSAIHERLADDTSDGAISFLENMTDTYNDMENRATSDDGNWEQRYRELDETWKKRYTHRFFSGGDRGTPDMPNNDSDYDPDQITVNDLFKSKEDT